MTMSSDKVGRNLAAWMEIVVMVVQLVITSEEEGHASTQIRTKSILEWQGFGSGKGQGGEGKHAIGTASRR